MRSTRSNVPHSAEASAKGWLKTVDGSANRPVVKYDVVRPKELGPNELAKWRYWQDADPRLASSFLSPEFALAFGRHSDHARIAVLEQEGDLVGFLPFEMHSRKVAKSFAYDLSDVQAFVAAPETNLHLPTMMEACGIAVFEFDHWAAHQTDMLHAESVHVAPAPVIDIGNGYDAWLAASKTSQGRVKKALQKQRKAERELGQLNFTFDSTSPDDLRQLIAWKSEQYVRTGRIDRFAKPWFRELVEDLTDTRTDAFSLRLSRLDAGDRCIALYLSLRGRTVLTGWFPTYDPSPDIARYSPGMACMLQLIKAAADDGLSRIELGEGEADYKESFKTGDDYVAEGWTERRVTAALLRRAQLAPKRAAMNFVLGNPALRKTARTTLNHLGNARLKLKLKR